MIDKVDVRIPEFALPRPALAEAFDGLRKHPVPPFRSSRYYQYVCDLRDDFDVDAVVGTEEGCSRRNQLADLERLT